MAITVRFFAVLREATGHESLALKAGDGDTVADIVQRLERDYPAVAKYRPVLSYAVNGEYTRADAPVRDGDELAILPPISGGRQ